MPVYRLAITAVPGVDLGELEVETGLRCTPSPPLVLLDGELVDRAALHGVISRVHDLGADLVEVRRLADERS